MSEIRTPEEVQTLLAEVVRVQSWGDMAAYNELLDHDAALRARIAELEAVRDAAVDRAREEALLNIGARMEREGLSAQLTAALQRAEAAEGSVAVLMEALVMTDDFQRECRYCDAFEPSLFTEEMRHKEFCVLHPDSLPTAAAALRAKAGLADEAADLIQHKNVTRVSGYTNEHHTQDAEDWLMRYRAAGG